MCLRLAFPHQTKQAMSGKKLPSEYVPIRSDRQYQLRSELVVPRSIEETFAFFEDPRNLSRITPPWLNFVIRTPEPLIMRLGAEFDYTIRWLGLPMGWKTIITAYEPPHLFVDEQARGPYRYWKHTHTFEPTPGGTLVRDQVLYALPFGPLGRLAHWMVVGRQLEEIFSYRRRVLLEIFQGAAKLGR
jgi:ligand-binding SRPBCC domain-containing protein